MVRLLLLSVADFSHLWWIWPWLSCLFGIVMDHGDMLRDCRHMLLAMSSQISLLLAGLQRLEGQQRHPQPPPPPPIPEVHPPPLPPPSMPPPHLPATTVRPDHMAAPVTLVATTDSRAEHPALPRTVSVSTSWEHRRRRRSRHREPHRRRSRSHHRRFPERPVDAVPVGRRHAYAPKYPPAVKAMPACRPSGLPYER